MSPSCLRRGVQTKVERRHRDGYSLAMPATALPPPSDEELRLDLRGLKCPLPVLRAQKELARLPPGALLILECTDPMAAIDLPNLARETGDLYEGRTEGEGFTVHHLRKAPRP
jgi:tRNA 2-thiouridine synthesizing protein A